MGWIGLPAQVFHPLGGGRTVMTIRDVQTVHQVECGLNEAHRLVLFHYPQHMPVAVFRHEIVLGLLCSDLRDQGVDLGSGAVGQKHRTHLGAEGVDVIDAIILFVRPREFVLLDQIVFIGRHRRRRHQAGLLVLAHHLLVYIERGMVVAPQNAALDEALQVRGTTLIDPHVMNIHGRIDVYFGLVDVQKAVLVASGHGEGFVPVQHSIGRCSHPRGKL